MAQKNKISANEGKTKNRIKNISDYFKEKVYRNENFICPNEKDCRKSHKEKSHNGIFSIAQLHHIGEKYDLKINGKESRIVIVGQEFGRNQDFITLKDNHKEKMDCGETETRNPHMRGTTNVLRLLFGIKLGNDLESEKLIINSEECHIFDAFSLVNYLLCSAIGKNESMRGKSTTIMRYNCQEHFNKIIHILEPTIVIVQTKGYWKWIKNAFDNVKPISKKFPLYIAEVKGKKVYIASFSHPSCPNKCNWDSDKREYFKKVVKPTVKNILKEI